MMNQKRNYKYKILDLILLLVLSFSIFGYFVYEKKKLEIFLEKCGKVSNKSLCELIGEYV